MWKWIVDMLDRISALIGALVFSQAPMYMQQYKQQLAGHVAELQIQVSAIQHAASQSGMNLSNFIQKFTSNSDIDFSRQGEIMQKMIDRFHNLSEGYKALNQTSAFTRPFVFLSNLYGDIAKSTYESFSFGLEFSLEGLIYALIGLFFGYSIFSGLKRVFKLFSDLTPPKRLPPK